MALADKGKYAGSTAKGALTGAKIGSLLGPQGAAIGAGVGAIAGNIGARRKNKRLDKDIQRMEAGQLGMSDAEIRQKAGKAKTAAGQQAGAIQQDLAQQALAAGGGAIPAGQYAKMMSGLADSAAEQAANVQAQLELEDAALAQQEATRIKNEEKDRNAAESAKLTSALGEIADPAGKVLGEKLGVQAENMLSKIFGTSAANRADITNVGAVQPGNVTGKEWE